MVSNETWKSLLDELGHVETKNILDKVTDKIVLELRGARQVGVQVLSEGAMQRAVRVRHVLLS